MHRVHQRLQLLKTFHLQRTAAVVFAIVHGEDGGDDDITRVVGHHILFGSWSVRETSTTAATSSTIAGDVAERLVFGIVGRIGRLDQMVGHFVVMARVMARTMYFRRRDHMLTIVGGKHGTLDEIN